MRPWLVALAAGVIVLTAIVLLVARNESTPAGQENVVAAASAATAVAEHPETYVSPRFGYEITYDEAIWDATTQQFDPTVDGVQIETDSILFTRTTTPGAINILGERGLYDDSNAMPACAEDKMQAYIDLGWFEPLAAPVQGGGDGRAWAQYDYNDQASGVRTTLYVECRWLGSGVTLWIYQTAPAAEFSLSVEARDELLAGLDTTGVNAASPTVNATPDASSATGAVAESVETYVSPRYGYAITYDEGIWDTSTQQNSLTISGYLREMDVIELRHRTTPVTIRITGERGWIGVSTGMPSCVEDELRAFTSFDGRAQRGTPVAGGGDGRAWGQVEYDSGTGPATLYAECQWLGGGVTLTIRHTAPAAEYPSSVEAREELLAGLDTSGIFGENATLTASPVGNATPAASPIAITTTPPDSMYRASHVMDADGANPTRLILSGGSSLDMDPAWSPDGTMIAFASDREEDYGDRVYLMDADGANLTRLSSEYDTGPAWAPGGAVEAW